MIQVYHNNNFLDYGGLGNGLNRMGSVTVVHVANVPTDSLELAWQVTNSIDDYWGDGPKVIVFGAGHRSSSVGDVFRDAHGYHVVEMMGFRKLGEDEVAELIFKEGGDIIYRNEGKING